MRPHPYSLLWLRIKNIIAMTPRAREYGIRYYWDATFRKKVRNKWYNKRKRFLRGSSWEANYPRRKRSLLRKQHGHCLFCPATENLTIDHIVEISKGGSSHLHNLRLLCEPCHVKRHQPGFVEPIPSPYKKKNLNTLFAQSMV